MEMIPVQSINGNQFMKARTLLLPVIVLDMRTFRLPSASSAERDHTVEFDSAESPTACSCTCEAARQKTACWAMARALDVMALLAVNNVYVLRAGGRPPSAETAAPAPPPLVATIDEAGEMALMRAAAGVPAREQLAEAFA